RLRAETAVILLRLHFREGRAQHEQRRRVEAAFHIGDLRLDHLERADRMPERLALAHPREARLVGGTRQANRLRGDADATRVENAHRDRETLAFRPEHVLLRAYVVAELDLASRRRANAELGLGLAGME